MAPKLGDGLRAVAAASLSQDPVLEWQREALQNLRATLPARGRKLDIRFRLNPAFLMVGGMAAVPLAGGRSAIAALALLAATVVQQLPALWLATRRGIAILTLDGCAANVTSVPVGARRAARIAAVAGGSLLNLASALGLFQIAQLVGSETRAHAMLGVAAPILAAWGVAQLVPLVPFATGRALAQALVPRDRLVFTTSSLALVLGGGLMVVTTTQRPSLLVAGLASGMFAFAAWRTALHQLADEKSGVVALIARAEGALQREEPGEAVVVARSGLSLARSSACRSRLHAVTCWGAIGEGDPFLAHAALGQLPREAISVHLVASYLRACGRLAEAEGLLLRARELGQRTRETTKLLIDVELLLGKSTEPTLLAQEDEALLDAADLALLRVAGLCRG